MAQDFDDYVVPRLNEAECEERGTTLNKTFGGGGGRLPPIMEVYANARKRIDKLSDLELLPKDDDKMGDAIAYAMPGTSDIYIRKSLIEGALDDSLDARFALVHELMHVIFHNKVTGRAFLKQSGNSRLKFQTLDHETAEWQADRIARATLMPLAMMGPFSSPPTPAARTKMANSLGALARAPLRQALLRFDDLNMGLPKALSMATKLEIARATLANAADQHQAERAQNNLRKLELWGNLACIAGEDPLEFRLCENYRISWSEFGLPTACGWFIENEEINSFYAKNTGTF